MEAETDISGVLVNPVLMLRFHRIIIIEWLDNADAKTGAALSESLTRALPNLRIDHIECRSKAQVLAAIASAMAPNSPQGIPIIHIETHGIDGQGRISPGFAGPGPEGTEQLEWAELAAALTPINIATNFNLLLVGAACFGEGPMMGIQPGEPLPYTALVGFKGRVAERSLREAMIKLYRCLLIEKSELGEAVEAANRELYYDEDSELRLTTPAMLIASTLVDVAKQRLDPENKRQRDLDLAAEVLRRNGYDLSKLPLSAIQSAGIPALRAVAQEGWRKMFCVEEMPENAARFAISIDRIIEIAMSPGNPDNPQ